MEIIKHIPFIKKVIERKERKAFEKKEYTSLIKLCVLAAADFIKIVGKLRVGAENEKEDLYAKALKAKALYQTAERNVVGLSEGEVTDSLFREKMESFGDDYSSIKEIRLYVQDKMYALEGYETFL